MLSLVFGVLLTDIAVAQDVVKLPDAVQKKTKCLNQEFLLYRPKGMDASSKAPLLIFLHGRGKRGQNIGDMKGVGRWMLFGNVEKHKLLLVMPQCLKGKDGKGWWNVGDLNLLLEHLKKNYNIDEDRIYLAGYSMGGFGTWAWAMSQPKAFAAIAPVSGGGDARRVAAIKHVPIWVFHGKNDKIVPHKRSEEMVEALKSSGAEKVKFTSYPDHGHDTHGVTFRNSELYKWLLSHKK